MNSRDRLQLVLQHKQADKIPLDLGSTPTTGMHVSSVYKLRQALQLDPPGTPVRVFEPYQMLGEIQPDLIEALGVDVVGLAGPRNFFGYANADWKSWKLFDGTPVLVPNLFNTVPEPDGSILMFPEGNRSAPPSARMPKNGFYFDSLPRVMLPEQYPLNVEENLEEFKPITEEDLLHYAHESERLFTQTDKAIVANFGGTAFGDIALVPAPWLKYPRGIRNIEDWYMSTVTRKEYIYKIFERQCEVALDNLARLFQAIGNRISVVFMSGTDFGMQSGSFISRKMYRDLYKPFQKTLNDWVHQNTTWKCFIHSCGSIINLMPDMIEAGFDIFNPVQTSAAGMLPRELKMRFGNQVTFWGGGVDPQQTLSFGTPDSVYAQVKDRMEIFGQNGGFVFNTCHNVQAGITAENLVALYQAVKDFRTYRIN